MIRSFDYLFKLSICIVNVSMSILWCNVPDNYMLIKALLVHFQLQDYINLLPEPTSKHYKVCDTVLEFSVQKGHVFCLWGCKPGGVQSPPRTTDHLLNALTPTIERTVGTRYLWVQQWQNSWSLHLHYIPLCAAGKSAVARARRLSILAPVLVTKTGCSRK